MAEAPKERSVTLLAGRLKQTRTQKQIEEGKNAEVLSNEIRALNELHLPTYEQYASEVLAAAASDDINDTRQLAALYVQRHGIRVIASELERIAQNLRIIKILNVPEGIPYARAIALAFQEKIRLITEAKKSPSRG